MLQPTDSFESILHSLRSGESPTLNTLSALMAIPSEKLAENMRTLGETLPPDTLKKLLASMISYGDGMQYRNRTKMAMEIILGSSAVRHPDASDELKEHAEHIMSHTNSYFDTPDLIPIPIDQTIDPAMIPDKDPPKQRWLGTH